ncbi:hypothetical protein NC981_14560 [Leptolyngbya sp. DQ-M1]|uniref:hypothetical protein n=1 Tax=Leptolyngbya sp. DQ-M1 TaxID=2933920 RepID=UPI0032970B12
MIKTVHFPPRTVRSPIQQGNRLKRAFWILGLSLGLFQAWAYRFALTAGDAVSYLDIGDAYVSGAWQTAINSYWSPLYSWLLGIALLVLRPSPEWEFFVVKLVNFGIFVIAFISFEFFLQQWTEGRQHSRQLSEECSIQIPEWAWLTVGYSLFLWAALGLTGVQLDVPDNATSACVYATSGFLLKMRSRTATWGTYLLFGMVLGLGYLSKAVMFPLAFVFFLVAIVVSLFEDNKESGQGLTVWGKRLRVRRSRALKLIAAMLAFILVAVPFVTALSVTKGRLTFGDSGKLNYIWYVSSTSPKHTLWQGEEPNSGIPKHPPRQIVDRPATYEFATPISGTLPLWFDPSYWNDGWNVRFDLKRQCKVLAANLRYYYQLFLGHLILSYCLLVYAGGYVRASLQQLAVRWYVWCPGVAGLAVYLLGMDMSKAYVSSRYVAPFVVLVCMGVLSSVCLRNVRTTQRLIVGLAAAALSALAGQLALQTSFSVARIAIGFQQTPIFAQIAEDLQRLGVKRGDSIAVLGESSVMDDSARLARIRIIAQIPNVSEFWKSDVASRNRVLQAIEKTGAKVVVQEMDAPLPAQATGWQKLKNSNCYVYFFNRPSARMPSGWNSGLDKGSLPQQTNNAAPD